MTIRDALIQLLQTIEAAQRHNADLRHAAFADRDPPEYRRMCSYDLKLSRLYCKAEDLGTRIERLKLQRCEAVTADYDIGGDDHGLQIRRDENQTDIQNAL